jgi:predicted CoA-binding protein
MAIQPSIAIIGASKDVAKYGNKAVRAYLRHGYDVFPVHPTEEQIEGLQTYRSIRDVPRKPLDRVSLYIPPERGLEVIHDVAQVQPREVWLNPGAESPALVAAAKALGLNVVVACRLIAVGADPHDD